MPHVPSRDSSCFPNSVFFLHLQRSLFLPTQQEALGVTMEDVTAGGVAAMGASAMPPLPNFGHVAHDEL